MSELVLSIVGLIIGVITIMIAYSSLEAALGYIAFLTVVYGRSPWN